MRKLYAFLSIIALLLLVCPGRVQSQVSSYNFTQVAGTYSVLGAGATTSVAVLTDNAISSLIPIPFSFTYNAIAYSSCYATTNGFLTLGGGTTPSSSIYAPVSNNGVAYNTAISGFSADLVTKIKYQTIGTAPSRTFIVEWSGYRYFIGSSESLNFQVRLYETTNIVEVQYGSISTSNSTFSSYPAEVGLKSAPTVYNNVTFTNPTLTGYPYTNNWNSLVNGASQLDVVGLTNTIFPASGTTLRWTPSTCTQVTTAATASAITGNSASISWTNSATYANGYRVRWRKVDETYSATTWTTPVTLAAGSSSYTITGLAASTYYVYSIEGLCSGSSANNYSTVTTSNTTNGKGLFTTSCGTLNVPYTQNFDAVTAPAMPACMAVENTNGDAILWKTCTATSLGNSTAITPNSGSNQMGIAYNGSVAMNDWFFLPGINLTGGTTYRLSFYARGYTGLTEQLEVKYGNSASSGGMTTGTIMAATSLPGGVAYTQLVNNFTPATTGVYYIGFHGISALNQWYLFVDDISLVIPGPTLNATSPASFGNICTGATGGPNSFTLTGSLLTAANITVGALSGYTYSTTVAGTYTSTLSLTQPGGSYSQTIYVKFNPTLVQSYNGNISISGAGATAINVAVTGSGVNTAPTVTAGAASAISTNTATQPGTITSTGCTAITAYGVEYSTVNGFANGTGTLVSSSNLSGSGFSSALTGLSSGTVYYVHTYATNAAGTSYSTQSTFTTSCIPQNVPYVQNFDAVITPAMPPCMSVENTNADAYNWQTCTATSLGNSTAIPPQSGSNQIGIRYNSGLAMNDWFYLPAINLTGGVSYRLSFYARGYTGSTEQIEVKYGTSASAAGMTAGTILASTAIVGGTAYTQRTIDFTPASTGVYYIGFHGLSISNQWYLFVDDISLVVTPPTLSASTLATFGNVCTGTTTSAGSFTVTGTALTAGDISIAALSGFSYSSTLAGTYTPSLLLAQGGGNFSQVIYVKFNPTLVQSYSGNITISGGSAIGITAAAVGVGVNTAPSVSAGAASAITGTSATVGGNILSNGCSALTVYGIEYSTINGFANGSGTGVTSSNLAAGSFSAGLSALTPGTTYYFHAYATNAAGTGYSSQGTFTTACAVFNIPYSQNFDAVTPPAIPPCMSVENTNADAYAWKTCNSTSLGNGTPIAPYSLNNQMGIQYNGSLAMNDWFYLPAINLTGGVSYRLSFYVRGYTGLNEQVEVKYGTSAASGSMSTTIFAATTIPGGAAYAQKLADFTPATTGVYYVGFHGISASNQWYLYIDNVYLTVTNCNAAVGGTATASTNSLCNSGSATLSATGYSAVSTGLAYQWQSSTSSTFASAITDIPGGTNPASLSTGVITATTYYRLRVTCTAGPLTAYSNIVTVTVNNPQVLSTTANTRCGIGSTSLQATVNGGSGINWYTAASGGAPIGTSSPFATPSIAATTNYYVSAGTGGGTNAVAGPASPTAQGGIIGTQTVSWGVYFNITQAITLQSIDIFPVAANESSTLNIYNSGGTLLGSFPYTTTVSGGLTAQTIPINLLMPVGTGYSIDASSLPASGIRRNNSGGVYPYTSGAVSITGNAYDNTYFMGFYNWRFSTGCESARTLVVATVTPPPALALTASAATICSGSSTTVSASPATLANFSSYSWSPATGVVNSGTPSGSTGTLSPTATTTYLLSGTTAGGCVNQASYVVTVNPAPPVTIGATLCSGSIATISAASTCSNYTDPRTSIAGNWNGATDPIAIQPVIFLPNSTSCEFDPDGHTMNYTTLTFQVTVSGTYNFVMDNNTLDGMGYIVTGPFVPGVCPGTGTWVVGDDDSGPGLMPMMDAPLVAGVTYTLITTVYSSSSGTSTGAYNWSITPPAGGLIVSGTVGTLQWWTAATGGTVLGTGSPFNPVGVSGSGFPTNTTAGSQTYYAACSNNNTCRTATTYTINATGQWIGGTSTAWSNVLNWCGGVPTNTTDVLVTTGVPNMPVLSTGTGIARNITVNPGATLTVNNAILRIGGSITASNNITAATGTIELNGASTQAISGSAFTGRTLQNLIASNSVNVSTTANDSMRITGALSFGNVNSKLFNSGDNVILVSNAAGTARVADITNNGVNTGNSIAGKFVVQRYIPARRAWRLVTAPLVAGAQTINQAWQEGVGGNWALNPKPGYGTHITGGTTRTTAQGFDQGPLNSSIYSYNGTAWNVIPATTSDLVTSKQGFMLFVRGSRAINLPLSTTATVADNTILRPTGAIKFGTQPAVTGTGFTVVGNPYPSAINFNKLSRTGVIGGVGGNAYYVWDPAMGGTFGQGAFITFSWNGTDYDKNIGPSNIDSAGIISSGAAFMVNLSAGGSIGFSETSKEADGTGTSYLFRPTSGASKLRMTLYAINANNEPAVMDGNLVTFSASSSNAVDDEDAVKPNNFSENFAVLHDGVKLSIERRQTLQLTDTIFYTMWNMKVKHYRLECTLQSLDLPNGATAFLEDTYLGTKTALSNDGINNIDFDVTADAASSVANRFRIVFAPPVVLPVTFTSIKAFQQGKDIAVQWMVENEFNIRSYSIERSLDGMHFTAAGSSAALGGNRTYDWLDVQPASGTYFYRIQSIGNNGQLQYSQVVKVVIGKGQPSITIYPNPVRNNLISIAFTNLPANKYQANLYNAAGQLVMTKQINHTAGNSTEVIRPTQLLAAGTYQLELKDDAGGKETIAVVIE